MRKNITKWNREEQEKNDKGFHKHRLERIDLLWLYPFGAACVACMKSDGL